MNQIETLTARIEESRRVKKNPCKNYATQAAAEKATAEMAARAGRHFDTTGRSARYVVFYNEAWSRWVGAVDLSETLSRQTSTGGFVGFCVAQGFLSY